MGTPIMFRIVVFSGWLSQRSVQELERAITLFTMMVIVFFPLFLSSHMTDELKLMVITDNK